MNRRSVLKYLAAGTGLVGGGLAVRARAGGNPYYSGPVSDHFDGTRFFNPQGDPAEGLAGVLRWKLLGKPAQWPEVVETPHPQARPDRRVEGNTMRVTMVGHATMLIQVAGANILTDPVWSERVSPFEFAGPQRHNRPGIAFADLPPIDLVLVSHNHYDHLDTDTLKRLVEDHDPQIITPFGNDTIIRAAAPDARIETGDWGDVINTRSGLMVHLTPAHHWSARGVNDRYMALWSGFVIETVAGRIYHVGDTGYFGGRNYRAVRERFGALRLAVLPIGAYEPRWFMKSQHQNPAEAVEGFLLCGAAHAVGHHWGTFQLTDEGARSPAEDLSTALQAKGLDADRFAALLPGAVFDVPANADG